MHNEHRHSYGIIKLKHLTVLENNYIYIHSNVNNSSMFPLCFGDDGSFLKYDNYILIHIDYYKIT